MNFKISENKKTVYLRASAQVGGKGTKRAPFSDFASAFALCKALLAEPVKRDITLSVGPGTYYFDAPVKWFFDELGHKETTFTIEGVPGKTVFSALSPLDKTRFEKVGENLYAMPYDGPLFRYLYVDGKKALLCRHGAMHADDPDIFLTRYDRDFDAQPKEGFDPIAEGKVYLRLDSLAPLLHGATSGRVDVSAEWNQEFEWKLNIIRLLSVDLDDTVLYEKDGISERHVACYVDKGQYDKYAIPGGFKLIGRHYFLQNAKDFLTEENAYFLDTQEKKLYYYTEGDVLAHEYARGGADRIFSFSRLRNTTFRGLTFTGTDDTQLASCGHTGGQACGDLLAGGFPMQAALYSLDAYHVTVENCEFYELGCEGLRFRGRAEDITVRDCYFHDLGGCAVRMGGGNRFDSSAGCLRLRIENNLIERIGTVLRQAPAIQLAATKDSFIGHNTLRELPYTGISIGWCWSYHPGAHGAPVNIDNVTVCYNYISDYMREMNDGGAIYTLGGNAPKEDATHYNRSFNNVVVMTNRTGTGRGMVFGIYYDGSSTSWYSRNNLVVGQSFGSRDGEDLSGERDEHYIRMLRARRRRSIYFYSQFVGGAFAYNILHENCYFIRPQKQTREERLKEAHYGTLCDERGVLDVGMRFVEDWEELPKEAEDIISYAGARGFGASLAALRKNRY